jgi:hypothetical protein
MGRNGSDLKGGATVEADIEPRRAAFHHLGCPISSPRGEANTKGVG